MSRIQTYLQSLANSALKKGQEWGKTLPDKFGAWIATWGPGVAGAILSYNIATESAAGRPIWVLAIGLILSLFWKPGIAIATAASTCLFLQEGNQNGGDLAITGTPILMWLGWLGVKLYRKEKTGLEDSWAPLVAILLAIWMATGPHGTIFNFWNMVLLVAGIIAGGREGRLGIVMTIWLMAANLPEGLHKNYVGQVQTLAVVALLTTPGVFSKLLAIAPTLIVFEYKCASAHVGTTLAWAAYLTLWAWEALPPKWKKGSAIAAFSCAGAGIATLPMWGMPTAEYILGVLGRDLSFTGRTDLWRICYEWLIINPSDGWGPHFWGNQGEAATYTPGVMATGSSHNTYIQFATMYGVCAAFLSLLMAFTSSWHRGNSLKSKVSMFGAIVPNMADLRQWAGTNCIWYSILFGGAGDREPAPYKTPGWKTITALGVIAISLSTTAWKYVPNSQNFIEEMWLVRPYHPDSMIAHAHDPNKPINDIRSALETSGLDVNTSHRERGMILFVTSKSEAVLDEASDLVKDQGHIFMTTGRKPIELDHHRGKLFLMLLPLGVFAIWVITPKGRPIATIALGGVLWMMPTKPPEKHIAHIRWAESQWKWDGNGNEFHRQWDHDFRERIRFSVTSRKFNSQSIPATYRMSRGTADLVLTYKPDAPIDPALVEAYKAETNKLIAAWDALPNTPTPYLSEEDVKAIIEDRYKFYNERKAQSAEDESEMRRNPYKPKK